VTVTNFTPLSALAGGALIGLSAAGMWWLLGRLTGVSTLFAGMLNRDGGWGWQAAFLAGLLVAGILATLTAGGDLAFRLDAGYGQAAAAGLLVGIGTRLSNGCTSGHGVCGVGRLSTRSILATLTFMATGFLTVYAVRHLL
jgi:uncharacterized membrane protein YedE/YeeE